MSIALTWEERALAAERTVEVLKLKICALYAGDSSAIQRQVDRANKRQDALRQRRELSELRAMELARYNATLETEVRERTQAIRTILDHVTSGFLLIGPDLVVRSEYSASCHSILAAETVAGTSLLDLLRLVTPNDRMELEMAIAQVFDDVLPPEVTLDVLPWRFEIDARVVKMDARIVRENGAIVALLVTFNDITDLERAERQAQTNRVLVGILKQRSAFQLFVADANVLLSAAREALAQGDQLYVRRAIHTIKGNAAAFGLTPVVEQVHDVESGEIIELTGIDQVESSLKTFLTTYSEILEIDYSAHDEEHYDVSETAVEALRRAAKRHDGRAIERWTGKLVLKRADCSLGPLRQYVDQLAQRLGKRVNFELLGGETLVDARMMRPVFRNLVHVLRNAIDHGVEAPEDRGQKPAVARVQLRIWSTPTSWDLEVRDDGRGIDPDTVARLAFEKGFIDQARHGSMTADEKKELIFVDGFSTSATTSDVSGRGVGMSAMKSVVHELDGTLQVLSAPQSGTSVVISIPKDRDQCSSQRPPVRASAPPPA
jgi:two-component system chemotaxis sensor kinase CheA